MDWKKLAEETKSQSYSIWYKLTGGGVIVEGIITSITIVGNVAEIRIRGKSGQTFINTEQSPHREIR